MILIVGLGNPGGQYERHRHNVGFMAADAIADAHGFGPARAKFQGRLREGRLGTQKALALCPTTFMNESGRAVGEAARFHKIAPEDVVVIHDELDLAPGKMRAKAGGGHAGHNGLRSIHAHLGADYRRLRIGIGHPGHKDKVSGYVLHDFAKADHDWLDPLLAAIARHAPLLAEGEDARFQSEVARETQPAKPPKPAKAPPAPAPGAAKEDEAPRPGPFGALSRLLGRD